MASSRQTTAAIRTNYRDAGAPASGLWFGRARTASGEGVLVTIERHGRGLTVRDAAGETVDSFGDTAKFWFAPAPVAEVTDAEREQAEVDAAHVEADHLVTMARLCDYRTPMDAIANRSLHGMVLAHRCTDSSLAHAASVAYKAGRRALGAAIEARRAAVQADVAAAEYAHAVDCATRTTVALPPAPVVEQPAELVDEQVVIVPCGGKKDDTATRAGDLYVGSYHLATRRAAAAIAERTGARVLILSALYGLITLDQRVAPYNLRMGQPGSITADQVRRQATALGVRAAHVTVLAGKAYADVITAVWPDAVRPLDGTRGIGPQLARLKEIAQGGELADQQAPAERPGDTRPALRTPLAGEQLALFPAPPLDLLVDDLRPRPRARRPGRRIRRPVACRVVALVGT